MRRPISVPVATAERVRLDAMLGNILLSAVETSIAGFRQITGGKRRKLLLALNSVIGGASDTMR